MKSIWLFMIFVVCQLEGKKFLQDNFKIDYNYYLRKQDLHIIKTQNDLSNAWYLPPQKAPKEHSWVDFAKKYLNMMDYLGTYFLPFYHSFTPIFQWYFTLISTPINAMSLSSKSVLECLYLGIFFGLKARFIWLIPKLTGFKFIMTPNPLPCE